MKEKDSKNKNTFEIPQNEYQDEEYDKILEKEIEEHCDFNAYVDKLELEDKTDDDLILLSKQEILAFKNKQIKKLKAYIVSLEREKEVLIESYKETTNQLLDKLKDVEYKITGIRPETPMITKNLNRKKGGVNQNDFKDISTIKKLQRCPNCTKEFFEDQFIAHALHCLRKTYLCKKCNELVDQNKKKEHIDQYINPKAVIRSIETCNEKQFQLAIDHGFNINSVINPSNSECAIHLISRSKRKQLLDLILKQEGVDLNIQNKNKETPLIIAIEERKQITAMELIKSKVDFAIRNKGDMSPLMLSCKYNLIDIVKALIALGADINEKNILGETPLKIAQIHKNEDLAIILLKEFNAHIKLK